MLQIWPWLVSLGLAWWFWLHPPKAFAHWPKYTAPLLFLLKTASAFGIVALYTWHYTDFAKADVYRYFNDGMAMAQLHDENWKSFWSNWLGISQDFDLGGKYFDRMANWVLPHGNRMYNDNRMVIRLHGLFGLISGRNIWQHVLLFSWLGFFSAYLLGKAMHLWLKTPFSWSVLGCMLFPSLLVWGSGPLKEPIVLFGLAMFFLGAYRLPSKKLHLWFICLFGAWMVWKTKFYVLALFLPLILIWLVGKHNPRFWGKLHGMVLMVFLLGIGYTCFVGIVGKDPLLLRLVYKQKDFIELSMAENAGSLIPLNRLKTDWGSVLKTTPQAFANASLRPLPWHLRSWMEMPMLVENLFFIWVLFLAFRHRNKTRWVHLCAWAYVLGMLLLLGLTTPVLGGLFRYKLAIWPVVWGLFLYYFPKKPISNSELP